MSRTFPLKYVTFDTVTVTNLMNVKSSVSQRVISRTNVIPPNPVQGDRYLSTSNVAPWQNNKFMTFWDEAWVAATPEPGQIIYIESGADQGIWIFDPSLALIDFANGQGYAVDNVAFVDPSGDDGTGQVGNPAFPFFTIQAARAAIIVAIPVGERLVYVNPGTYTLTGSLIVNPRVDYYFSPQTFVNSTSPIFDASAAGAFTCRVYGAAEFTTSGGAAVFSLVTSIVTLYVESARISSGAGLVLDTDGTGGGTIILNVDGDIIGTNGIEVGTYTINLRARNILLTNDAITMTAAGTLNLECDTLQSSAGIAANIAAGVAIISAKDITRVAGAGFSFSASGTAIAIVNAVTITGGVNCEGNSSVNFHVDNIVDGSETAITINNDANVYIEADVISGNPLALDIGTIGATPVVVIDATTITGRLSSPATTSSITVTAVSVEDIDFAGVTNVLLNIGSVSSTINFNQCTTIKANLGSIASTLDFVSCTLSEVNIKDAAGRIRYIAGGNHYLNVTRGKVTGSSLLDISAFTGNLTLDAATFQSDTGCIVWSPAGATSARLVVKNSYVEGGATGAIVLTSVAGSILTLTLMSAILSNTAVNSIIHAGAGTVNLGIVSAATTRPALTTGVFTSTGAAASTGLTAPYSGSI